jgi:hypothetical protein
LTSALEGSEGSASRPGRTLPPGKTRYPFYRRLGGPQGRSGQVRKISPPPGFDPQTVQPVSSRYTDYATWPTLLILNFNKTYYTHFTTISKLAVDIHISHKINPIIITYSTNFLGLTLDSMLYWKTHIDQLSSKPNSACDVIRSLKSVISTMNLRTVYFSYAHSIMKYGIIFWGISSDSYNIFRLQKRVIRIIMNAGNRISCHELFKK